MTNGDKIRRMSDDEIAQILSGQCACCEYQYGRCDSQFCICVEGVKKWLQKEVSEDVEH